MAAVLATKSVYLSLKVCMTPKFSLAWSGELSKWWRATFILLWWHSWLLRCSGFWFVQVGRLVTSYGWRRMEWNHKKWNISEDFCCIELKLFTVVILITKFQDKLHFDISMATQWAPGPLHPKDKIRVSLLKKSCLLCVFSQWVWANMDLTQHKYKKVC